jgi:hypothetical protein
MQPKLINHKPILKHFRMICARTNSVHLFKAFNVTDARCQARVFFNGPVNNGGIIME